MRIWKAAEPLVAPAPREQETIKLTCRFITPVFGGGVDPKQRDPITPVRVPALRGQLRFWWRATSPLGNVAALRDAEARIFGGVHDMPPRASQISIAVTRQPGAPRDKHVFVDRDAFAKERGVGEGLAYGAFPLRSVEKSRELKIHNVLFDYPGDFEIALHFPGSVGADVRRALWALFHFGGLGGRTRRGFGALALERADGFDLPSIDAGWPAQLSTPPRWPVIGAYATSATAVATPAEAHELGLGLLREMRQGNLGRRPNRPTPGRSYWPEPDAIRALTGRSDLRHRQRVWQFGDKFPRAAFGAPIIFHFKDKNTGDPDDTTLVPFVNGEEKARFASPLLIRPHKDEDGRYRALAVKLAHPDPAWGLKEVAHARNLSRTLTPQEAAAIPALGKALHPAVTNPVDAYLVRLSKL